MADPKDKNKVDIINNVKITVTKKEDKDANNLHDQHDNK